MNSCWKTVIGFTTIVVVLAGVVAAQQEQPDPTKMMELMKKYTTPGKQHRVLEPLIGEWETEMSITGMPPTKGTAKFEWILGKRFVKQTYQGTMMGQPYEGMGFLGYDLFKKKFTSTWLASMDTAQRASEGLLDRTGKIITFYGAMDEYLTGEHDKTVKYVMNMTDPKRIVFEVHDLAIGEPNTMVIKITYEKKGRN